MLRKHIPLLVVAALSPILTSAALAYSTPTGIVVFKKRINIKIGA